MTNESADRERVTTVGVLDPDDIVRVQGTKYRVYQVWREEESWPGSWCAILEACDAPQSASWDERTGFIYDVLTHRGVIEMGGLYGAVRDENDSVEVLRVTTEEVDENA